MQGVQLGAREGQKSATGTMVEGIMHMKSLIQGGDMQGEDVIEQAVVAVVAMVAMYLVLA